MRADCNREPHAVGELGTGSSWPRPDRFRFPARVENTTRGTYLVVDTCNPANVVCEIDPAGVVLWEMAAEPRVCFAAEFPGGATLYSQNQSLYLLERSGRRTLFARLPHDEVIDCGFVSENLVVVGSDRCVTVLSLDGEILEQIWTSEATFRSCTDVKLSIGGGLLVADSWASCVVELGRNRTRVRTIGQFGRPGPAPAGVRGARSACQLPDGRFVVANTLCHRLDIYSSVGQRLGELDPPGGVRSPAYVAAAPNGVVVADQGNRRVLHLALSGEVLWQFGAPPRPRSGLSYPRTVEALDDGDLLVCDAGNDRVVRLDRTGSVTWSFGRDAEHGGEVGLELPRSAALSSRGEVVISDGLNGRVLVVAADGRVEREVSALRHGGQTIRMRDPHCVRMWNDALLIVDSDHSAMFLAHLDGTLIAEARSGAGVSFEDPHYVATNAQHVALVDSGNGRIVLLVRHGSEFHVLDSLGVPSFDFDYPRSIAFDNDGQLLVCNTDAGKVVSVDSPSHDLLWSFGPVVPVDVERGVYEEIRTPRCVARLSSGQLVVCDHGNSRLLAIGMF